MWSKTILFVLVLSQITTIYNDSIVFESASHSSGIVLTKGSMVNYQFSFEKFLSNGDRTGFTGLIRISFLDIINSSILEATMEIIFDLSWFQDKEEINFAQNIETREITIKNVEGVLSKELQDKFSRFSNGSYYSPILLPEESVDTKSNVILYTFNASFRGISSLNWNYQRLEVALFSYNDQSLSFNASFEKSTGLLISAQCLFLENTGEGFHRNYFLVILESSNISFIGERDYSSLTVFLMFLTFMMVVPIILVAIWVYKRAKVS